MKTFLRSAQQLGELRHFDLQFANHIVAVNGVPNLDGTHASTNASTNASRNSNESRYSGRKKGARAGDNVPELLLAAALASNRLSHGDTCLPLDTVAQCGLYTNPDLRVVRQKLPKPREWRRILLEQNVVAKAPQDAGRKMIFDRRQANSTVVIEFEDRRVAKEDRSTDPVVLAPLILDDKNRLYLARYWMLERSLIHSLERLIESEPPECDHDKLKNGLSLLFEKGDQPDWQKVAVANAVTRNFCVITGGPGTGKTYTVTALLAALLQQGVDARKIALAAPTGKAAARLTQSIQTELAGLLKKLQLPDELFEAVTLHSLLGSFFGRIQTKHHAEFPLPYDVVIIDEASMIDLPLMARTFEALAPGTRIILIGDKDQLHSVESGMVLGDICGARSVAEFSEEHCNAMEQLGLQGLPVSAAPGGKISDHIVYLHKSHRVKDDGGISKLATAVNEGDSAAALELLLSSRHANLELLPQTPGNLDQVLREHVVPTFKRVIEAESASQALQIMTETGVLCALKNGRTGALKINTLVEKHLQDLGVIEPGKNFYHGRPLMISENSHHQKLYNGDHGLILHDEHGMPLVHFAFDSAPGVPKKISPSRLPQHETFFAMTIHKSQGSEFSTAVVVLPESDSPILSRELLYTAITRARGRVVVLANQEQLKVCVERRSVRQSGLREVFWSAPPSPPVDNNKGGPSSPFGPVQTTLDF